MDAMLFTMTGVAVIAVGILLWTNTKAGKNGLKTSESNCNGRKEETK